MRFFSSFCCSFSFFPYFFVFSSFGQPQEWPSVTSLFCRLLIIAQLTSYYRDWHAPLIVHHHANTFLSAPPPLPRPSSFSLSPSSLFTFLTHAPRGDTTFAHDYSFSRSRITPNSRFPLRYEPGLEYIPLEDNKL